MWSHQGRPCIQTWTFKSQLIKLLCIRLITIMHDQERASNVQQIKIGEPGACLKELFVKILLYTHLSKVIDS